MRPPAILHAATAASVGSLLVVPALLFAVAVILKTRAGVDAFAELLAFVYRNPETLRMANAFLPPLLLGGTLTAFVVNMLSVFGIGVHRDHGNLRLSFSFEPGMANVAVLFISASLFITLGAYAAVEHLTLAI